MFAIGVNFKSATEKNFKLYEIYLRRKHNIIKLLFLTIINITNSLKSCLQKIVMLIVHTLTIRVLYFCVNKLRALWALKGLEHRVK